MPIQARLVRAVVEQHCDEAAHLWCVRQRMLVQANGSLHHLLRWDRRLVAHLDGSVVAGPEGFRLLLERLAEPDAGAVFAVVAVLLEGRDRAALEQCLAAAEAVPETVSGAIAALGWVPRDVLTGVGRDLLVSPSPFRRRLGLAACRVHGVDPGAPLSAGLQDATPAVRAEALKTAGVIGRRDLLRGAVAALDDPDPDCRFQAARSAVLLGERGRALEILTGLAMSDGPHQPRAFTLAFQAMSLAQAQTVPRPLAADPAHLRPLIHAVGIVGDPNSVPWLIGHMAKKETARAAGEAFSLITGLDLAWHDLERKPPDKLEAGPTDDPEDDMVEMDPDEGLPWPATALVQDWWREHGGRLEPGVRHFAGAPVASGHAVDVLKAGTQRQRILASQYLVLLAPGTPLFNTSAPAWRQRTMLAQMG